ncbi:hypothetical protein GEMRC1_008171 [Eukaryota sp. GEM-RC1]
MYVESDSTCFNGAIINNTFIVFDLNNMLYFSDDAVDDVIDQFFSSSIDILQKFPSISFIVKPNEIIKPELEFTVQRALRILQSGSEVDGNHVTHFPVLKSSPIFSLSPLPSLSLLQATELADRIQLELNGYFSVKGLSVFKTDPKLIVSIRSFLKYYNPNLNSEQSMKILSSIRDVLPTCVSCNSRIYSVKSIYPRIVRDLVLSNSKDFFESIKKEDEVCAIVYVKSVSSAVSADILIMDISKYSADSN